MVLRFAAASDDCGSGVNLRTWQVTVMGRNVGINRVHHETMLALWEFNQKNGNPDDENLGKVERCGDLMRFEGICDLNMIRNYIASSSPTCLFCVWWCLKKGITRK